MAGRRFLSLTALVAALVLLASTGTSWAHPAHRHGHADDHHHLTTGGHGTHGQRSASDDSGVVRQAIASTDPTTRATTYRRADRPGHAHGNGYGSGHRNLAAHPGKAVGLFKHADRFGGRVGHQHTSSPAVRPDGDGEPQPPTRVHTGQSQPTHQSANPHPAQNGGPATPTPTGTPPPHRAPTAQDPAALAQVLLRSNPVRFTVLPIIVISVLALAVCGLIGLARHRA